MNDLRAGLLFVIIGLILSIFLSFLGEPCFALPLKTETIISYINLNDTAFYDVEILLDNSGTISKIYLPFKQLSEVFEVTVRTDHATKEIFFETSDHKTGKVGKNFIDFDGKRISTKKNFYLQKGLMEEVKDEIFCSEDDLSTIFGATLRGDKNDMSVIANTDRKLVLLESEKEDENDGDTVKTIKFKAYTNVLAPPKPKKVVFESFSVNNNTMSDSVSQYMLTTSGKNTQKNMFLNNNTQLLLKGKAYGGDLSVDMNTYNYKGQFFSFGGLGFNYKNKYKDKEYELGRVRGFKDADYTIGTQMFGAQVSNYESKKKSYREINGIVAKDSLVKVYVDEVEHSTLSTYDGYYSLENLYLTKLPNSIKIEELKADGTTQIVFEKKYPKYDHMPARGQKKYSLLTGATGYNNKLFSQSGYIYEMNTKKFVMGSQVEYGIRENLKLDSKIVYDKIYYQPKNSIWQNIYSSDALLTSGTWKNPNSIEGMTSLNTVEYIQNENLKYRTTLGASTARDLSVGGGQNPGFSASADAIYQKEFYSLKASVFDNSSDFYLAGGDGSFISDRLGAGLSGNISKNGGGAQASIKKYYSNNAKRFEGGLIDFNEYNFGINKSFEKFPDFRFNINGRDGKNAFAKNSSYYYDLNFSKRINANLNIQAGKTESNYKTEYESGYSSINGSTKGYTSLFSTVYGKMDYRFPKNKGTLALGHDSITYNYSNTENQYNMMKIGYTFPEFKNVTLSLGTGYKYTGSDKGFDMSANLAFRTKSGRTINLNYQFNRNGGYIINNMYLPMSSRHSINLVLNDAFAVLPSGLKSVGFNDENKGFVEVVAYIDKNKNGVYDKGDIGVKDVPVKCSWVNDEIYTNNSGKAAPYGTDRGVYNVKIDPDKLPATLLQEKSSASEKIVRVDARQTTIVEFPLKSCVGNVSGKLKIIDDFGRKLNIKEFIVVLNDEEGKETAYSTVDEDGSFYLSGISPGKYTVQLDKSYIEGNNLQDYEDKSLLNVEIPYEYKKFVDVKDLNLMYKTFSI